MVRETLATISVIEDHSIVVPENLFRVFEKFEPHSVENVKSLLTPGDTFVDVGANFGFYSVLASVLVGDAGVVHAIEPSPQTIELLIRNIDGYKNVELHRCAVGDKESQSLFFHSDDYVNSGFAADPFKDPESLQQIEVPVRKLDDLLSIDNEPLKVDFLKVDVQGDDVAVLRGAESLIESNPSIKVLVEWAPAWMHNSGFDYRELPSALVDLGLSDIVVIDDWTKSTMSLEEFEAELKADESGKRFCNLLAQKQN